MHPPYYYMSLNDQTVQSCVIVLTYVRFLSKAPEAPIEYQSNSMISNPDRWFGGLTQFLW